MGVMTHNTQLLIATERERWLTLHLKDGMTIMELKRRSGFSRDTLHRWKRDYLAYGFEGLKERSRAHRSHPQTTPQETIMLIRKLRTTTPRFGAKKIALRLGKHHGITMHWRGVHKVLVREKLVTRRRRLMRRDRWHPKATIPGELVEIDVAYARKHKGRWLYQFTAVDACTRWRYLWVTPEQSNRTALQFLRKLVVHAPFRICGIKTDNASIFTNYYTGYRKSADPTKPKLHIFDRTCHAYEIMHYLIDPGKPAQNGKVERSHRTDREEFWRTVTFRTLSEIRQKQSTYVDWYNREREHLGIEGLTPLEKLEQCQI
jgi:transposase InsO family protein